GRRDRKVDTVKGNVPPVASDAAFSGAVILGFHPILIERSENREPIWNGQQRPRPLVSFRCSGKTCWSTARWRGSGKRCGRSRQTLEARMPGSETRSRLEEPGVNEAARKQKTERMPHLIQNNATFDQMGDGSS
ncbi:hypothetical protein LY76DRAFT_656872, partial [Colletotrichum caudatum]